MEVLQGRVIRKKLLIKPHLTEEITKGGIIMPGSETTINSRGLVKIVGDDVDDIYQDDTIIYNKTKGTEVTINFEAYILLKEEDVLYIE